MEKAETPGFRLGQKGLFAVLDAFGAPTHQLEGTIVYLAEFHSTVYAILLTSGGDYRPVRIN